MSLHPVIPWWLLAAFATAIVAARLLALRRLKRPGRPASALWRWSVLTVAALLVVGAAARPVLGTNQDAPRIADPGAPNVFLLVDRSADMDVPDAGGGRTRMASAREDVAAVIDRYPDARFAVIGFASRPDLEWPLSPDVWSLGAVMSAPSASTPDDVEQVNAAAAGNLLRYQLIGAVQQYPRAQNLVFYFGAGAGESRAPQGQFNLPDDAVHGGLVLGYGTAAGGSFSEQTLRTVSEQIGVPYIHREDSESLSPTLPALEPTSSAVTAAAPARTELYWVFAVGAAALLLVELYLEMRAFRRTRMLAAKVEP
jgi:Ca-activated chloride channel homolog